MKTPVSPENKYEKKIISMFVSHKEISETVKQLVTEILNYCLRARNFKIAMTAPP